MTKENFRLRDIRKNLGITQKEFSESVGIKQGSYSDIERGKVGVSANLMKNLIIKYRISPIWLFDGKGDKFLNNEINKGIGVAEKEITYNSEIRNNNNECEKCKQLESVISAYKNTIDTQKDYIKSLKGIISKNSI